ncbi:MAG: hypothetical protein UT09_C0011G0003 [Parcubacteria group bacterium GW2011_GWF2_38_8]|nr:MAG: hypothetical protein UT09_C0011G0003 [Parcubacteria group bacterium GW2011_GWF2_38_8]
MSKRNIIILFLILISLSIAFFVYIKKNNEDAAKSAEQMRVDAVMTELNNFKIDPAKVRGEQEVVKELNSFKVPPATAANNAIANGDSSNSATVAPAKPKTQTEVIEELNSFQAPAKSSDDTSNSLNNFNP